MRVPKYSSLLQERVAGLATQIAQRDAMEERMEACVYAIFERLEDLEAANFRLRERLARSGAAHADAGPDASEAAGCGAPPRDDVTSK